MKINNAFAIFLIAAIVLVIAAIFVIERNDENPAEDEVMGNFELRDYPLYPIEELLEDWRNDNLKEGLFNTTGFLARYFECPACPAGAACAPCKGEGLNVSAGSVDSTDISTPKILIITENYEQFTIGKRYEFSVSIDSILQRIELVGIRAME